MMLFCNPFIYVDIPDAIPIGSSVVIEHWQGGQWIERNGVIIAYYDDNCLVLDGISYVIDIGDRGENSYIADIVNRDKIVRVIDANTVIN